MLFDESLGMVEFAVVESVLAVTPVESVAVVVFPVELGDPYVVPGSVLYSPELSDVDVVAANRLPAQNKVARPAIIFFLICIIFFLLCCLTFIDELLLIFKNEFFVSTTTRA